LTSLELGYDSELVIDSDDEEKLEGMPDFEKERILQERHSKVVTLKERYQTMVDVKEKSERRKKGLPVSPDSSSSDESAGKKG